MGRIVLAFVEGIPVGGDEIVVLGVTEELRKILGRAVRAMGRKECPDTGSGIPVYGIITGTTPSGLNGLYIELYGDTVAPLKRPDVQAVYVNGARVACRFHDSSRLACEHADAIVNELRSKTAIDKNVMLLLYCRVEGGHAARASCCITATTR